MPEWTIGTGCKPVGLRPTEVRILLCPPSTDALHERRFTEQSTHNTLQVFFLGKRFVFYQEIAYNLSREKMLALQRGKRPVAVPKEPQKQGRITGPVKGLPEGDGQANLYQSHA